MVAIFSLSTEWTIPTTGSFWTTLIYAFELIMVLLSATELYSKF